MRQKLARKFWNVLRNPIRLAMAAGKQFGCHVRLSLERKELDQKFQLFWKALEKSVTWHLSIPEKLQQDGRGVAKTARTVSNLPVNPGGTGKLAWSLWNPEQNLLILEDFLLVFSVLVFFQKCVYFPCAFSAISLCSTRWGLFWLKTEKKFI